ncbi:hypothetical protein [Enterovibrio coralii]|nr:hypothetical protein [Enterovibrio coralii]
MKDKLLLGKVLEYKEITSIESKELDVICLLINLLSLRTKKISNLERGILIDHIIMLLSLELNFCRRMKLFDAEVLLMNIMDELSG